VQSAVQQTGESGCEQGTESRRLCARERNVEDTATLVVAQCRVADIDQWEASGAAKSAPRSNPNTTAGPTTTLGCAEPHYCGRQSQFTERQQRLCSSARVSSRRDGFNGSEALQRAEELKPGKYQVWGDFEPFGATKTTDQATGRAAAPRRSARSACRKLIR
jgi:hypothetical protein